jgi:hypothetical protein
MDPYELGVFQGSENRSQFSAAARIGAELMQDRLCGTATRYKGERRRVEERPIRPPAPAAAA